MLAAIAISAAMPLIFAMPDTPPFAFAYAYFHFHCHIFFLSIFTDAAEPLH